VLVVPAEQVSQVVRAMLVKLVKLVVLGLLALNSQQPLNLPLNPEFKVLLEMLEMHLFLDLHYLLCPEVRQDLPVQLDSPDN
jgi:sterol desaturase/sphingolipid hydroxylase (fatty acid hydroxylase superfamily)